MNRQESTRYADAMNRQESTRYADAMNRVSTINLPHATKFAIAIMFWVLPRISKMADSC